ncbi:hypothetical protein GTB64_004480 [Salmonella enterica]|nr:hypothetical protein [Salmonella enterica]
MSVFFNGQLLVTPVTASAVNDDAMLNQNLSVGNNIGYVGIANGGKPQEVYAFGTPDEARQVLVSGELCDAVTAAFSPSEETGSPQTVYAVRVNPSEPAKLVLPFADKAKGAFCTFVAKRYSAEDLLTKVTVEAGSKAGLFSLKVEGKTSGMPWTYEAEDFNASVMTITALVSDAKFMIGEHNNEAGMSQGWPAVTVDPNGQWESIDLSQYQTIGELADYLNSKTDILGQNAFKVTFTNDDYRDLPITAFDAGHVAFTGAPDMVEWPMFRYGLDQFVLAHLSDVFDVEWPTGDGYLSRKDGPAAVTGQYFSRAVPVAPTVADWESALHLMEMQDLQWVQAVSGNDEIHAQIQAHVTVCSNVLHRERRSICGTQLATTDLDALAKAKALNSKRISLVHIGHYAYDAAGKLALRPAYMTAGLVAAAFAGVNPGTPLTNKTLAVRGLERDLRNPTDTDKLLKGGVMPIENTETGYKVTQSITTWLVDSKYNNREQSCGVAVDFAIRNVRQAVDVLRGSKQSPILLSRAVSLTKGTLTELSRPEPQGPAVLVGDENSPAFRNVTATIEGDVLRIQFEASPAIPNNYILVTMYAVPYSGSATA